MSNLKNYFKKIKNLYIHDIRVIMTLLFVDKSKLKKNENVNPG